MRERWYIVTFLVAAAGCGGESAASDSGAAVRDSAGIRMVENAAPGPELVRWVVPDSALLDIGGADEGPASFTRLAGAFWDNAGRIVVADNGAGELRRFDSTGGFLDSFGRKGAGPGEFRWLATAWDTGDSIFTHDPSLQRITVFGPDGQIGRTISTADLPRAYSVAPIDGGRLLMVFIDRDTSGATSGPTVRQPMHAAITPLDTIRLDTVLTLPGMESYPILGQEGEFSFPAQQFPMFGRSSVVSATGDEILATNNEAFEIAKYDTDGALKNILRVALPPEPVQEADHRQYLDEQLRQLDERNAAAPEALREQWRNQLREQRVSEHFPFIDNLVVAEDAYLWAELYRWRVGESRRYLIFDPTGRLIARAELPDRVKPLAIRKNAMLALWLDADDVPHVRVYPVRRPASSAADGQQP